MRPFASFIAALVAATLLAACGGGVAPNPVTDAAGATRARHAGYTVSDFTYRTMPLRTSARALAIALAPSGKIQYPADLINYGGPIMANAAARNIYVNCKAGNQSCWGDPEGFQKRLTGSVFASLLTQYTGKPATAYTFAGGTSLRYPTFSNVFYDNDLFTILHTAIAKGKLPTGFSNLYHIFLPKGAWTCFDASTTCYSPGNNATFGFCAYHAYVRFSDIGLVVYSVEPYQNIKGCASKASAGASALTNSTASTLGHETFESITDPGQKYAWYNFTFGSEIGDLCETYEWTISVGGAAYSIQPMYSDKYHACAAGP